MYFTSGQKEHKHSDVTMETRHCSLLQSITNLKALLAFGIKDLWISFEPRGRLG
jgi:hypothetical protein